MKTSAWIWITWAIKNIAIVLCYAAIAVHFGKWWIVLFSIFGLSDIKSSDNNSRICDGCGAVLDFNKLARQAGWLRRKRGDKYEDYCPECRRKQEEARGGDEKT